MLLKFIFLFEITLSVLERLHTESRHLPRNLECTKQNVWLRGLGHQGVSPGSDPAFLGIGRVLGRETAMPGLLPFHHLDRWLDLHTQGTSDQLILMGFSAVMSKLCL